MDINQEHVNTLLCMGFQLEDARRSLKLAKNDLSEAVAILTDDHPTTHYSNMYNDEPNSKNFNLSPPQSYHDNSKALVPVICQTSNSHDLPMDDDPLKFPVANLYDLESKACTEAWSIPYKKEESLGRCLLASIKLAERGLCDQDSDCNRFMYKCLPDAFNKLLTSNAVNRWNLEVQQGIHELLQLFIQLLSLRWSMQPPPIQLFHVLAVIFNPETEFNQKNKTRQSKKEYVEDPTLFTISFKNQNMWLIDLINMFGELGGFKYIRDTLENHMKEPQIDCHLIAALFSPVGHCSEFLDTNIVEEYMLNAFNAALEYAKNLNDFKDKNVGSVCEMLEMMKLMCFGIWPHLINVLDELRLSILLKMLKFNHFNSRMNSLREVKRLIEDSRQSNSKTSINSFTLMDWLVNEHVLSIAMEANLDKVQYCERVRNIIEYLGGELSVDELTRIWNLQTGESLVVISNIHNIIVSASTKFNADQFEALISLIRKSWLQDNFAVREQLLQFIGYIGRENRISNVVSQVLELVWEFCNNINLDTKLREKALESHLAILNGSYAVSIITKKYYVTKCVENIKENRLILHSLRHILDITKCNIKASFVKTEKDFLIDLNKNHDLIRLVTQTMCKYTQEPTIAQQREYITTHLDFLRFILVEATLFLSWIRCKEIWNLLIINSTGEWEKETCFNWFASSIRDLETETRLLVFQKELLRLDPAKLSKSGFLCFKCYLENVNQSDNKLQISNNNIVVEKMDLIGLNFLWRLCLSTLDDDIAEMAIALLLNLSYLNLSHRLKKDTTSLHRKFIDECNSWLKMNMAPLHQSTVTSSLLKTISLVASIAMPNIGNILPSSRSGNLLSLERLLLIAKQYVISVEESYVGARSIPQHGTSFIGQPIRLIVSCETHKKEFTLMVHSNENVYSLKWKISQKLSVPLNEIQFLPNDKVPNKDGKILGQLNLENDQIVNIKILPTPVSTILPSKDYSIGNFARFNGEYEAEKSLPGVMMSNGDQVFETLYKLASIGDYKVSNRARNLLMLIPTDPNILEQFDNITVKSNLKASPSGTLGRPGLHSKLSNSTQSLNDTKSPETTIASLLSIDSQNNSFQLLYNLQVLSGKIMPPDRAGVNVEGAKSFTDSFLMAGGFEHLMMLLKCISADSISHNTLSQSNSISFKTSVMESNEHCGFLKDLSKGESCNKLSNSNDILNKNAINDKMSSLMNQESCAIILQILRFVLCDKNKGYEDNDLEYISLNSNSNSKSSILMPLEEEKFSNICEILVKVAWPAAIGRKGQIKGMILNRNMSHGDGRNSLSVGSAESGISSGSEMDTGQSTCTQVSQTTSSNIDTTFADTQTKDAYTATESLHLILYCLECRPEFIGIFYNLPGIQKFIIDMLVSATETSVRDTSVKIFQKLSLLSVPSHQPSPHQFLVQTLTKARLPYWMPSSKARGASHRVLTQCSQYFELYCRLISFLTLKQQHSFDLNAIQVLNDEISWLLNFVPCSDNQSSYWGMKEDDQSQDHKLIDSLLMTGHMRIITALITCDGVDKKAAGSLLIKPLIHNFLFQSSNVSADSSIEQNESNAKCMSMESRVAAYNLLIGFVDSDLDNFMSIEHEIITIHHQHNSEMASQWDYMPPVDGRIVSGFVGLKNGGATCYMNSVLQQIYMTPNIADSLLSIDDDQIPHDSVLYQVQLILGHLLDSQLQYYVPEGFWNVFKLWGSKINIREQQDALDFFQALIDQLEDQIKKIGSTSIFKKTFQGSFSDQKICHECNHCYEREEAFYALNVTVKTADLQDSLEQFVKGELLEGDNAYFCEKCGVKRTAIKRMCLKSLPPVLCIQLKRFDYDWEANRAIKFDDHFKFPFVLDMEPYTVTGVSNRDKVQFVIDNEVENGNDKLNDLTKFFIEPSDDSVFIINSPSILSQSCADVSTCLAPTRINYDLVGVVVHSGQANAGHYYSFIKDRRGNYMTNPSKGKWFKFNDTSVEEFEMNEANLESECYGGQYKTKVFEQNTSSSQSDERMRYWNGYLLFYECLEDVRTPVSAKKAKVIPIYRTNTSEKFSLSSRHDSLKQLTQLVHKGEKRGLFTSRLPASIHQIIRHENQNFLRNRNIYEKEYFRFMRKLASKNINCSSNPSLYKLESIKVAIKFLFNTYFRTKSKLRSDMKEWEDLVGKLLIQTKEACIWLAEFMAQNTAQYIKPFLLECPNKDIRITFLRLIENFILAFFHHGGNATNSASFNSIIDYLLSLLERDVPDHCRQCIQYFQAIYSYVHIGIKACSHMFMLNGYRKLLRFLIGDPENNEHESKNRRWSSIQAQEFGPLHASLSLLILHCDVTPYKSEDSGNFPSYKPITTNPKTLLNMSNDMISSLYGSHSHRFLQEIIYALREVTSGLDVVEDMLLYCSHSNKGFSIAIINNIFFHCMNAQTNELKIVFNVLMNILLLEDVHQQFRIKFLLDDVTTDDHSQYFKGILASICHIHTTDSRRAYNFIKFLVNLSTRCVIVREFLLLRALKWQWAVNWLNSKMDNCWGPQSDISNEDATGSLFQRTISAQNTLEFATALLTESQQENMDISPDAIDLSDMSTTDLNSSI